MAEATKNKSAFDTLNSINVNDKKEQKNKLDYLSWPWAWAEVKKRYPTATYEYIKNADGWNYHTDGRTAWVEVAVEIDGIRYEEHLPVMDYRNASIPLEKLTSFDVNKAQKRCLVKCIAMHGLGLYIYAGEDLPEESTAPAPAAASAPKKGTKTACAECGADIKKYQNYPAQYIVDESIKRLGRPVCMPCWLKMAEAAEKKQAKLDGEMQAIQHEDAGDRV